MGAKHDVASIRKAVHQQGRQQRRARTARVRGGPAAPAKPVPVDTPQRRAVNERLRRLRQKKRAQLDELKRKPCADCGGEFHPFVMDFDHRDDAEKLFNVSASIPLGLPFKRVLAEVAKCDIVCANCHRMRTFRRLEQTRLATPPAPVVDSTRCRRGHVRTEDNTHWRPRGDRMVRECRLCEREVYRAKREAAGKVYNPRGPRERVGDRGTCVRGHPYSDENTHVRKNARGVTVRDCRVCARAADKKRRAAS
jgi:hypothetical protein